MGRLEIGKMYFGKTDAHNEYVEYGNDLFKELFFDFPGIDINNLLSGKIYYILGDKGTGKTMLLKYLESLVLEDRSQHFTQFIRFKKDIDEKIREQLNRSDTKDSPEIIDTTIPKDVDTTLAWQLYLIKTLVAKIRTTEAGIFKRNSDWFDLVSVIDSIYGEQQQNQLQKVLPKIKHGNLEINVSKIAKISLDLDWISTEKVSFYSIAKSTIDLFKRLTPDKTCKLYIFIDELELTLRGIKQYKRDSELIRDLIIAIHYLSEISKMYGYNIFYISAIRNEVYTHISSIGYEINKLIEDFGVHISWQNKGLDINSNPLIKMIEHRITRSETQHLDKASDDIWDQYFVPTIKTINSDKNIKYYLLNQFWYKPRDIVRFFNVIKEKYSASRYIDKRMLESIRQKYAEDSWNEFKEILSVKYTPEAIVAIKYVLTGLILPFEISDFENSIIEKSAMYDEVENLKSKKTTQVLRDLYDLGVIGNYGTKPRFVFNGDADIDPSQKLTIHIPLISFFKATTQKSYNV